MVKNVGHKISRYLFQDIAKGRAFPKVDGSVRARDFMRKLFQKFNEKDVNKLNRKHRGIATNTLTVDSIGRMYCFFYDAKLKDELPYWDKFPLIFPFHLDEKGFLGINLHYLPLNLRSVMMDNLFDIATNDKYDETTKLKLSYEYLKGHSKLSKLIKPCIKRYLWGHVRSKFIHIPAAEWDNVVYLPLQKWQKANAATVYRDSRNMIK